jgi:hypothetical protein
VSAATTYGFIADPGTQQTEGQLPELTSRLNTLAQRLHLDIYGISGYRSPAHSVAVGGFADDPHTKGEAEDIGVGSSLRASAAQLTNKELASVGLERPFDESGQDPAEVNHIQLIPGAGSSSGGILSTAASVGSDALGAAALASNPIAAVVGGAAGAAGSAVDTAAGDVGGDLVSAALGYLEPRLEQGALYGALIFGGVGIAGYGLVKMLEPTGTPQALRRVAGLAAA